jgi:hypothetical protein
MFVSQTTVSRHALFDRFPTCKEKEMIMSRPICCYPRILSGFAVVRMPLVSVSQRFFVVGLRG